ncbi:MAG: OpgC domain-containing protein, partial [Pseudomonadales bacterium]|nr:OpgC domain-containing protein [Pseudomonadales bacterium]
YFLENPKAALVASSLLKFRPGLMDPLPLYIVLLAMLVVVLPFLFRRPLLVFLFSAELYLLAIFCEWNLEARPSKVWFFNPFAWQFLFFIGALIGAHREALSEWVKRWHPQIYLCISVAAFIYLVLSALIVLSWRWPAIHDAWMPLSVAQWLYPISKTDLAGTRLLHFLVLALAVALWVPQGRWLERALPRVMQAMGRHSLPVFCTSVMLSPMADALNASAHDQFWVQCVTALGGVLLLWCVAQLLEWYRRDERGS